jgi:predicted transcriptional regulator
MARLSAQAHSRLQVLAGRRGQSQQEVLEAAIALYERKEFFEEASRAYERLRDDSDGWRELNAERELLSNTISDGLSGPSD